MKRAMLVLLLLTLIVSLYACGLEESYTLNEDTFFS